MITNNKSDEIEIMAKKKKISIPRSSCQIERMNMTATFIDQDVLVLSEPKWTLVGESSQDSLFVRGGPKPIAIRVSHHDSADLLRLLADANTGINSRLVEEPT